MRRSSSLALLAAIAAACGPPSSVGHQVLIVSPETPHATNGPVEIVVAADGTPVTLALLLDGVLVASAPGPDLVHVQETALLLEGRHLLQAVATYESAPASGAANQGVAPVSEARSATHVLVVDRTGPTLTSRLPVEGGVADPAFPVVLGFDEPVSGAPTILVDGAPSPGARAVPSADRRSFTFEGLPVGPGRGLRGHALAFDLATVTDAAGNAARGEPVTTRWVSQPRLQRDPGAVGLEPTLALAPDGAPHVAWSELGDSFPTVQLARWTESGWARTGTGLPAAQGYELDLAFDEAGAPVVAATVDDWSTQVSRSNGGGWSTLFAAPAGGFWDFDPSVTTRGSRVAVSWTDEIVATPGLHAYCGDVSAALFDGQEWTTLGLHVSSGPCGEESVVALDGEGTPWVAWSSQAPAPSYTRSVRVARWSGAAWELRADFTNWLGHDLAVDGDGSPLLLLADPGGVRVIRFAAEGWTLAAASDAPAQASAYNRPSLSVNGLPAAAWSEEDGVHAAVLDAGALREVGTISVFPGVLHRDVSVVREGDGALLVAFSIVVPGASVNLDRPIYVGAVSVP